MAQLEDAPSGWASGWWDGKGGGGGVRDYAPIEEPTKDLQIDSKLEKLCK